nr:immunoglobulin light chain junction region [Macaca mulatta]
DYYCYSTDSSGGLF